MTRDEHLPPADLIEKYRGLVVFWAERASARAGRHTVTTEQLIPFGIQGLLEARHRYAEDPRPAPATPFTKAIHNYIRKAIYKGIRPERAASISLEHDESIEAMEELTVAPTQHEFVRHAHALLGRMLTARLLDLAKHCPQGLAPALHAVLEEHVAAAVAELGPCKERDLIRGHYYEGRPLIEVGRSLGIKDKSDISRLHRRALDRLREPLSKLVSAVLFVGAR